MKIEAELIPTFGAKKVVTDMRKIIGLIKRYKRIDKESFLLRMTMPVLVVYFENRYEYTDPRPRYGVVRKTVEYKPKTL